ncbi:hypothetical protein ACT2CR_00015 [Candidatus Vidania fulgoroideorum]
MIKKKSILKLNYLYKKKYFLILNFNKIKCNLITMLKKNKFNISFVKNSILKYFFYKQNINLILKNKIFVISTNNIFYISKLIKKIKKKISILYFFYNCMLIKKKYFLYLLNFFSKKDIYLKLINCLYFNIISFLKILNDKKNI